MNTHSKIAGLALSLALVGLAAVPALAQADPYEPNDTPATATQMVANTDYIGAQDTQNDVDYFVFYVPYQEQLAVTYTIGAPPTSGALYYDATMQITSPTDSGVNTWDSIIPSEGGSNQDGAVENLTVQRGYYYVEISGDGQYSVGEGYDLRVIAPALITQGQYYGLAAAIAARAADAKQVSYWQGRVGFWNRMLKAEHRWVTTCTVALRHAHGRQVRIARGRLNAAKRTVKTEQAALRTAQTNVAIWQGRWNADNAAVGQDE